MLLRAFLAGLVLTVTPAAAAAAAGPTAAPGVAPTVAAIAVAAAPDPTVPPVTANPYLPPDRSLNECISSLPKPDCGSKARGGWHQYFVLIALVLGLGVIGWRIIAGVRQGRPALAARPEPGRSRIDAPPPAMPDQPDQPPAPSTIDAPGP